MSNRPGESFRSIWLHPDDHGTVQIIDQRHLPHRYVVSDLKSYSDGAFAIREMLVRGAPLIGATAAWSLYLAALQASGTSRQKSVQFDFVRSAANTLMDSRPTAVNLRWAIERMLAALEADSESCDLVTRLRSEAEAMNVRAVPSGVDCAPMDASATS